MSDSTNDIIQAFEAFSELATPDKTLFLEQLLSDFTITTRAIWSDESRTDTEKLEALKWLNELCHRIWNLRADLQRNAENDAMTRMHGNMKFYSEQSDLLSGHLGPTLTGAMQHFKGRSE